MNMARRKLLAALGGMAATWPLAARAQQSAMPVVGFLGSASPDLWANYVRAFNAESAQINAFLIKFASDATKSVDNC